MDVEFPRLHRSNLSRRCLGLGGKAAIALLCNAELDTLALGEGDEGLLRADDEDVVEEGGKGVAGRVLDLDDIGGTDAAVAVDNGTNTASVATLDDHDGGANLKENVGGGAARSEVHLDSVTDVDVGIGVADGAGIVCDNGGDTLGADILPLDLAELELGLLSVDLDEVVAALDVVQETEVLASLGDGDNVYARSMPGKEGRDGEKIEKEWREEKRERERSARREWVGGEREGEREVSRKEEEEREEQRLDTTRPTHVLPLSRKHFTTSQQLHVVPLRTNP